MKTYKHRKLWWIVEPATVAWLYVFVHDDDTDTRVMCYVIKWTNKQIPTELVEQWSDREEVVEKDWIRIVFDEVHPAGASWEEMECLAPRRKAIEKHAPKTKKFTKEDVKDYLNEYWNALEITVHIQPIVCFLREHNLLSDDE